MSYITIDLEHISVIPLIIDIKELHVKKFSKKTTEMWTAAQKPQNNSKFDISVLEITAVVFETDHETSSQTNIAIFEKPKCPYLWIFVRRHI